MMKTGSSLSPLSLARKSLWNSFPSLQAFDQVANHWFDRDLPSSFDFHPATDISETKDYYLVSADLPGMEEKDIHIQMENDNSLTLRGQRVQEKVEKEGGSSHVERSYGEFQRAFYLPSHIDKENIQARYENGVLQILIPKKEKGKPVKIETNKEKAKGFFQKYLGKGKLDNGKVE